MHSKDTTEQEQISPEQQYDKRRRAFLKKAAIAAVATPMITTLLVEQASAKRSANGKPCCQEGQKPSDGCRWC